MSNKNLDIDDDFQIIVTAQRRELMAAEALESDLDLAFDLQLQEAINASLSLTPSTSSSPPPPPPPPPAPSKDEVSVATSQSEELSKFEQEARDRKKCAQEFDRMKEDLHRRIHDQNFARDILNISEDEWIDTGDYFERPYGEGSSGKSGDVGGGGGEIFRIYFKGLVSEERVRDSKTFLAGIGVAICDSRDHVVFEMRKPLVGSGTNKQAAEFRALIEGLNAALALDIKRLTFFVDYYPIFQFLMRRWPPKQRKIATLVNQVFLIQNKFIYCNPTLVARNDVKFAFKLAREAIVSQLAVPSESSSGKTLKENCVICLEDTDIGQMFSVDGCLHRYCFSCMKQHVEVKLLHGLAPKCPHEGCKSELHINSCKKFLTPKLIDMMVNRIKEASIPITEKVYCPYPRCSALMSKSEIEVHNGEDGLRRCKKCNGLFCVNCKVPWHHNMTCTRYRRLNPQPQDDAKLKSLATRNLWRQCVRCNHMIELAEGCFHMTCRCGYEFCYTCGAEWKNKKATCSCPLWDEENILHNDEDDEDDFNLDEDEYEEYFESDSDDYYW